MDTIAINSEKKLAKGQLDTLIIKENDYFLAIIPSLDLSGYGDTVEEAVNEAKKAYYTFCDAMFNDPDYDFEKSLIELGFNRKNEILENANLKSENILRGIPENGIQHQVLSV